MELEVEGRRPVGRPKKTWSKVMEQETRKLEGSRQRVKNSGGNSYHVQPQKWETRDVKDDDDDDDVDDEFKI